MKNLRKHSAINGLLSFSGGLTYHLRALRYQNSLWLPFKATLRDWLTQWNPSERRLTILGSSAGHCFPFETLSRFDSITLNDPDRFATKLFIQRASRWISPDQIQLSTDDLLSPDANGQFDWSLTEEGLDKFRDTALLFTNCLGQIPFLSPLPEEHPVERNVARFIPWRRELEKHLARRTGSWCTYHDVYSSDVAPGILAPTPLDADRYANFSARNVFQNDDTSDPITLQDHFMEGFMPTHPRHRMSWQLLPKRWHLIEGLYYSAPADGLPESSPTGGK